PGVADVRGRADRRGSRESGGLLHRALHGNENRCSSGWEGTQQPQPRAGTIVPGSQGFPGDCGGTVDSVGAYARSVDRGSSPDESASFPCRHEHWRAAVGTDAGVGGLLLRGFALGGALADDGPGVVEYRRVRTGHGFRCVALSAGDAPADRGTGGRRTRTYGVSYPPPVDN